MCSGVGVCGGGECDRDCIVGVVCVCVFVLDRWVCGVGVNDLADIKSTDATTDMKREISVY